MSKIHRIRETCRSQIRQMARRRDSQTYRHEQTDRKIDTHAKSRESWGEQRNKITK